ncbi:MAG: cysteine hydrolase [Tissierellia bacterium]|mgnify:CR=1 FL=1|jgi:nicotinamidase/pyrazinamidase|nr:cysteine hydrolase [Tissierellia bacterium]
MKLLIVVDYQKDFVDGALGFPGADLLDEGIAQKILNHQGPIIYTLDTHTEDYLNTREGKALPIEHCIDGTEGWNVYGKTREALKQKGAEKSFVKKETFGMSPAEFEESSQFKWPDQEEVESVELVGLVTNMCVISNAVLLQAKYPQAQIIVDGRLCDSFDKELHEKALDVMEGMQIKVIR